LLKDPARWFRLVHVDESAASAQAPYPNPVNRLRELSASERPEERLKRLGAQALSDAELLAMLLRSGTRGNDVISLASRLVSAAGSLSSLISWKEGDFRRFRGIGSVKAFQLVTALEIARRVLCAPSHEAPLLSRPEITAAYLEPYARGLQVEKFWVLCLDRKNRLLKRIEVSSGTATAALAHPREVFREAVRESASGIICAHNHPSGDPAPSAADVQVTRQLREASRALDIDLIDHLVLGRAAADPLGIGFYSFRTAGML